MVNIKEQDNNKVAIVCVGYNRLKSLTRLLKSLLRANYPSRDIPLVISIDASGDEALYEYVRNFKWIYGNKYVNIQSERLGLKNHIFQCGDLTNQFKAIILLEDDLVVSPAFYFYVLQTLQKYGNNENIAQISLYKNERNGYVGLPLSIIQNGSDVFLMQDVSTWGECWNKRMWNEFRLWLENHDDEYVQTVDMPEQVKGWTNAWSKYYNAYVVDTDKYCIYPNVSLTTNFSDAGVHGGDHNSIVQVNLQQKNFVYRLFEFEDLAKYDIYMNNIQLREWVGIDDVELDLYGFKCKIGNHKYLLSTKILPYKIIKSYALYMRPIELNVKNEIDGDGLFLYEVSSTNGSQLKYKYSPQVIPYFLKGFPLRLIISFIRRYYVKRIFSKIKK